MPSKNITKDVSYLNKDFASLRNSLIDFAKIYFPNTYNDFNELSPGMMFMEMAAYVGDILSFYTDENIKETFLTMSEEKKNLIYLAQGRGYNYKTTVPATVKLDVYQLCPSTGTNGEEVDFRFALKISKGMVVSSKTYPDVKFRTLDPVDFSNYSTDDFVATIYEVDGSGNPVMYLLKKSVDAVAGSITTKTYYFTTPEQFKKITLPYDDVIEILDVYDSDGNQWYEVDYLAQDTIFYDVENSANETTTDISNYQQSPYILKMKKVSKRFTTRTSINGYMMIYFGSGTSAYPDQIIIPSKFNTNFNNSLINFDDPKNSFLITRTYGQVPSNTTLTFRFTRGGGLQSNVPQGDLTTINSKTIRNSEAEFIEETDKATLRNIKTTVSVNNPEPATGGRGEESLDEIRENAIANFASQNRCVTDKDYLAKVYGMPAKYGAVTKAFVRKSKNQFSIDLYVLGYDSYKKLTNLSDTVKRNISTYISNYRDLTTAINIKNAFPINIAVYFTIVTYPKYNKDEVLLRCIEKLKDHFNIDKWQIGQPIILSEIYNLLEKVEGVKVCLSVDVKNRYKIADGYSNNYYHIKSATVDGIIYPSTDPSIFEVKYPDKDIIGRAK